MTEETVRSLLREIGLTDKESEVYIFLSKHGAMRGLELAKRMKKHKAQIYNIIKNLQSKSLVEATLEFPARFTAVPLETAIDLNIKAKREAAALIENTKKEILDYWKTISAQPEQTLSLERFIVIDGNSKIYPKFAQMIKETRRELSVVMTLQDLIRADRYNVFEASLEHSRKSPIQFRLVTEFLIQKAVVLEALLERMPVRINLQGRSPDLGLLLTPRMVIRDDEEILFFISSSKQTALDESNACLWTNCTVLVQSFRSVFEDLWSKSRDLKYRILELETGKSMTHKHFIFNHQAVEEMFKEVFLKAKKEVVMLASGSNLEAWTKDEHFKELAEKPGISIKVMMPICENSDFLNALPKNSEARRVAEGSLTTILVDGQHLFQFENLEQFVKPVSMSSFANYLYTNDLEYVEKIKSTLNDVWKNAPPLLAGNFELKKSPLPELSVLPYGIRQRDYRDADYHIEEYEEGAITEKEIIDEMIAAKKILARDPSKDMNSLYGSAASTLIHPPSYLNLPDMKINVWHCNKQSSFGAEDWLTIHLWLKTPKGQAFVAVAHITDNPKAAVFRKGVWAKTPAGKNILLLKKDQLQVRVQGNTLFAGWTVSVPLYPPQLSLPPCCVLFEGYGKLKSGVFKTAVPSGKTQVHKFNRFDALVTFFHPSSKYSASGFEGIFDRERIMIAYPPPSTTLKNLKTEL